METTKGDDMMVLNVKFGKDNHTLELPVDSKVDRVYEALETLTGVFQRCQKVIFKGKVLQPGSTLLASKVTSGAKLMLMSSQGGVQTAGQVAAAAAQVEKQKLMAEKNATLAKAFPNSAQLSNKKQDTSKPHLTPSQARAETWSKTGIVGLRDVRLTTVPEDVMSLGAAARVLDLGGNQIAHLPSSFATLAGLQRLRLSNNCFTAAGLASGGLGELRSLTILALDDNKLSQLPDCIGSLPLLKSLSASNNCLEALPATLGQLQNLELLNLRRNKIDLIIPELGTCARLEEVDLSNNNIKTIPEELSTLLRLKALLLDHNMVAHVPTSLLTKCSSLCTLSLHNNPITADQLRETQGHSDYQERRKYKYDKQLESRIMLNKDGFDEGADARDWQRH